MDAGLAHIQTLEARLDRDGGWKGPPHGGDYGLIQRTPQFKPFKTYVVPKRYPGFKHDRDGRCIVESRSQMETYRKQQGLEWT